MANLAESVFGFSNHSTKISEELIDKSRIYCINGVLKSSDADSKLELPDLMWNKFFTEKVDRLSANHYRLTVTERHSESGFILYSESLSKDHYKILVFDETGEIIAEEDSFKSRDGKSTKCILFFNSCPTYKLIGDQTVSHKTGAGVTGSTNDLSTMNASPVVNESTSNKEGVSSGIVSVTSHVAGGIVSATTLAAGGIMQATTNAGSGVLSAIALTPRKESTEPLSMQDRHDELTLQLTFLDELTPATKHVECGKYLVAVIGCNTYNIVSKTSYRIIPLLLKTSSELLENLSKSDENLLKLKDDMSELRDNYLEAQKIYQLQKEKVKAMGIEINHQLNLRELSYKKVVDGSLKGCEVDVSAIVAPLRKPKPMHMGYNNVNAPHN